MGSNLQCAAMVFASPFWINALSHISAPISLFDFTTALSHIWMLTCAFKKINEFSLSVWS